MQIPLACPHCRSERAAFEYKIEERRTDGAELYINKQIHLSAVMAQCQVCGRNVLVRGQANTVQFTKVFEVFPERKIPAAPQDTPEDVARVFRQAVDNLGRNPDAAGVMYRKTLDRVVHGFGKGTSGTLASRIDKVLEERQLTDPLSKWAHAIRELGNEAAHDTFTEEECAELHAFTEMLLTYLYTLPAMLEARRKAK